MAFPSNLHHSTRTGKWQRCVAVHSCQYGDHRSMLDLAKAGGAEVATNGHSQTQTVSPLLGGVFTVGTAKRKQSFREDGTMLSAAEARQRRSRLKKILDSAGRSAKRGAKRQLNRAVSRAKLRAKWAAQDTAEGVVKGIGHLLVVSATTFEEELYALALEFEEEWDAQLAEMEALLNPPGADC